MDNETINQLLGAEPTLCPTREGELDYLLELKYHFLKRCSALNNPKHFAFHKLPC
jgi:hypothetical protein